MKTDQKEDTTQDLTVSHKLEMVKRARKWFRKISSIINEVLTHLTQAKNLARFFSALALFTLFTEKVSQNSSFPYALKSADSNIQHRKASIFYFERLLCLKNEQSTFQCTLLTVSLLYNTSACSFPVSIT